MARKIEVEIIGDTSRLERSFGRASRSADTFAGRVTRSFRRVGVAIGIAAAAIGTGAITIGTKAVKAASDLNEEINKSNVLFGESARVIQKWSQTTAGAIGLSRRAALEAAGNFGAMFATIGVGERESVNMSRVLVKLGADLASFSNQDPQEMLDRLRSGLAGEAEPLRRFGILLSAARVEQEALRLGLVKQGQELTEQQKVQARYSLILQDSSKAQGDFARTSTSLANAQRIIRASIENISASLGQTFLPIVAKAASAFAGFLSRLQEAKGFRAKFDVVFEGVSDAARKVVTELKSAVIEGLRAIDWRDAGESVSSGLRRALSAVAEAVRRIDWGQVGQEIVRGVIDFLKGVDWVGLFKDIVRLWVAAFKATASLMIGIGKELGGALISGLGDALAAARNFLRRKALELVERILGAFSFLGRFDPFKGMREKVQRSLQSMEQDAKRSVGNIQHSIDSIEGKEVTIKIKTQVATIPGTGARRPEEGGAGHPITTQTEAEKRATSAASKAAQDQAKVEQAAATAASSARQRAAAAAERAARAAQAAKDKAQAAFDNLLDSLNLGLEKAQATRRLTDDLRALRNIEGAIEARIKEEGRTVALMRELFRVREQIRELQREDRAAAQFKLLGLGPSGEDLVPGVGALKKQLASVGNIIKGTFLDTRKTRSLLGNIRKLLSGELGKLSREVRAKVRDILGGFEDELKSSAGRTEHLTKQRIRDPKFLFEGLDLTREQRELLRRRVISGRTTGSGKTGAFGQIVPATATTGGGGNVVITGPVTVKADNPDTFMRELQKRARKSAPSRRGRHGGKNLGLG